MWQERVRLVGFSSRFSPLFYLAVGHARERDDGSHEHVVEVLHFERVGGGLEVGAANAGVIGEEERAAVGDEGKASHEQFATLAKTAAHNGHDADAGCGCIERLLVEQLERCLIIMAGSIEDKESDARTSRRRPTRGIHGSHNCLRHSLFVVATTCSRLGGDKLLRWLDGVAQTRDAGEVSIAVVAIHEGTGADMQSLNSRLRTTDDVLHLCLKVTKLIAHRAGCIEDEEHVRHFGRFTRLVDANADKSLCIKEMGRILQTVNLHKSSSRFACFKQPFPKLCFAGVVRTGLEEGVAPLIGEADRPICDGVTLRVGELHHIAVARHHLPVLEVVFVGAIQQFRPECPFGEIVDFTCGEFACRG